MRTQLIRAGVQPYIQELENWLGRLRVNDEGEIWELIGTR